MEEPACATDACAPADNAISKDILAIDAACSVETCTTSASSPAPAACSTAPGEPSPAAELPATAVPTAVPASEPTAVPAAEGAPVLQTERGVPAEDAHVTQPPEPSPPSSSQGPGAQCRGSVMTPRSLYRPSTQQPALGQQPAATEQPPAVDRQLKASVVTGDRVRLVPYCRAHVPRVHQWKQDLELLRLLASEPRTSDDEACRAGVTRGSVSASVGQGSWVRVRTTRRARPGLRGVALRGVALIGIAR